MEAERSERRFDLTVRGVTADLVGGHEEAGDDAEGPEGEEGGGEGDLLDGGAARAPYGPADEVVLVGDGEGVVHVGHAGPGLLGFLEVDSRADRRRRLVVVWLGAGR